MSASLAFFSLLSLIPLATFALSLAGWFLGQASARRILARQVSADFGDSVSEALSAALVGAQTEGHSTLATVAGVILMLAGGAGVAGELRDSLNLIWGAPMVPGTWKDIIRLRSREVALVLLFLLGVLAASVAGDATTLATRSMSRLLPAPAHSLMPGGFAFSLAVLLILFLLVHKYVPDVEVPWRGAFVAALCSVALFTAGKELVILYLLKSTVSSAFGSGQSVVALLLWAYFSSCVVFFGAEFAAAGVAEGEFHRKADLQVQQTGK